MRWINPPSVALVYVTVVVIDRLVSMFFGFERDAIDLGMDIGTIGLAVTLIISASRLVWCLLLGMELVAMVGTTASIVLGYLPLDNLSFDSMAHIAFGYAALGLILHPAMRKWIWDKSPEAIEPA